MYDNSVRANISSDSGNTLFVAAGIMGQPASTHHLQWVKSLTAIGFAFLGALLFNLMHRFKYGGQLPTSESRSMFSRVSESPDNSAQARPTENSWTIRVRWLLIASFSLQTLLMLAAALMTFFGVVSNRPSLPGFFSSNSIQISGVLVGDTENSAPHESYLDLVVIAILAFQSGGQVVFSRIIGLAELPTIAVSSIYHTFAGELFSIPRFFRESKDWSEFMVKTRLQRLRLADLVATFLGAVVGAALSSVSPDTGVGTAGALFLATGLKLILTIAFAVWKRKESGE